MEKQQTQEREGVLQNKSVTDSPSLVQITLRYTLFYLTARSLLNLLRRNYFF